VGDASEFRIEPLSAAHDRTSFSSGEPALDEYIRRFASQDMRRRVSQVFVATSPPDPRVIGYYTLSGTSFSRDELAPDLARRLPRYPVPAAIIGRLAVERSRQRQGFGERLLVDAFDRIREASRSIAVYAIVVDAKNDAVRRFYEAYGFRSFVTAPLRLYLPLDTLDSRA
jgi:ribosomal protein S18 acetylase RimI-like enzyme